MKKTALFAGSFDPLTNGHIDTISRAAIVFDEIVVAVSTNTSKQSLFDGEERIRLVAEALRDFPQVRVVRHTGGLTIEMARDVGACALLRGVRNVKDFEYEHSIASMNKLQASDLETVILLSSENYRYLSSSLIKEVAMFGGDVSTLVPANINAAILQKFQDSAFKGKKISE
ncbi:MAG: pantetheine-phosphate adenylyltransferase [Trichococcus flocculiformis]